MNEKSNNMKLYHFYHLYADGNWQPIVNEHFEALKTHGLYDQLDGLFVGFVGNENNINTAKNHLSRIGINYFSIYESGKDYENKWEQVTLNKLHDFCQTNDGYIFYAHTKGASNDDGLLTVRWRRNMLYHNAVKWKIAVEKLNKNDAVGCHWLSPAIYGSMVTIPFFGGNYWWVKGSIIKQIDKPLINDRYDAEKWIGTFDGLKIFDFDPCWPHINLPDRIF